MHRYSTVNFAICRIIASVVSIASLVSLVSAASLVTACSGGWSKRDEQFARTYVEVLLVREQFPDTAAANPKVRSLLTKSGFSEEEFRVQYERYAAEPETFRTLLDTARARIKAITEEERKKVRPVQPPAETVPKSVR